MFNKTHVIPALKFYWSDFPWAVMKWLNTYLFYKHTWAHEDLQFSSWMVIVVLRVLNMGSGFCMVSRLLSLSSWLLLWFIIYGWAKFFLFIF